MASDLSNILKNELANTLEQLLSKKSKVESVKLYESKKYSDTDFIECDVKFEFKNLSSKISFFIPSITATNFEYLILGGMGDLKNNIDDETLDAVNEIISNICGSFGTSVNAQGFPDVSSVKLEIIKSSIVESKILSLKSNIYEFIVLLGDDNYPVILSFDDSISGFFSTITGEKSTPKIEEVKAKPVATVQTTQVSHTVPHISKNLELLQSVKLKLSVRLGTKIVLLKDILSWDVGEIIELEQMVNEPLEVLVNGVKIGEGEAVIVEGKFGLRIKKIGNEELKLTQIGM